MIIFFIKTYIISRLVVLRNMALKRNYKVILLKKKKRREIMKTSKENGGDDKYKRSILKIIHVV